LHRLQKSSLDMKNSTELQRHINSVIRQRKAFTRIFIIAVTVLCCACGKKADPGLPIARIPEPPRQVTAVVRAEGIHLVWRAPDRNVDETPLLDLAGFKIQRAEMPLDKACRTCPREFREIFDYPYTGQRGQVPEKRLFYYQDTALSFKHLYTYTVRCYNDREHLGMPTKPLEVVWDVPPAPPRALRFERSNRLVRLFWTGSTTLTDGTPCPALEGYTVYRTMTRGVYSEPPINQELVTDTSFEDVPEKLNTTYFYTVRAVRRVEQTLIESLPSSEIEVAYLDLQPPSVPEGLTAVPTPQGILLKWIPKLEKDVAGINIYRSTQHGGSFVKLNSQPIAENSWIDTTVQTGVRYIYGITAVDRSPQANESPMSELVEVIYRLK